MIYDIFIRVKNMTFNKMVRFQYISDLHLDQLNEYNIPSLVIPTGDILILAGDICHIETITKHSSFFEYISSYFHYILYIPGNHEFYNNHNWKIDEMETYLKIFLDRYKNIFYLNNASVIIENILFTGSCLWCEPKCEPPNWFSINLTKNEIKEMYKTSLNYITSVADFNKNRLKHVIITHYPSIRQVFNTKRLKYKKYEDYYQNSNIFLNYPPLIWIFGHTHKNMSNYTNHTLYLSNQRKDSEYRKNLVITIDDVNEIESHEENTYNIYHENLYDNLIC
jgi:predicted phosphohydrolase